MNKDDFIKMYKDTKKEEIIEELFYKCKANYKLNNIIDELENWLNNEIDRIKKMINPKTGIKPYGAELIYLRTIKNSYIYAKDKLKELKGE